MKKLFIFLFVLLISSCSSNNNNEIKLFNKISFKLADGEKEIVVNPLTYNKYESYLTDRNIQIPLFKCVQRNDYSIYLGLPYQLSIADYSKTMTSGNDSIPVEVLSDSTNFCYSKHNINNEYITEYLLNLESNLVYVLAVTRDENLSNNLFRKDNISNRFIIRK